MELSKNFDHVIAEKKWYQHWLDRGYFHSEPDAKRDPYTIVIPPPNVTGVLHMGHCLNNTIQDILVRRARMMGKNACWVPGTDHASIATEAKVVQMLREQGIQKATLSREEFLKYAWEWKDKYGGIILQQLKKLGCSLDWERTSFTMDSHYYDTVINIFIELYNKGKIYRGKRMINWDPKAKTALSDEEVIRKEVNGKLYFIKYFLNPHPPAPPQGGETNSTSSVDNSFITIATVRPETILGDAAIAVHPKDERYKHLHGKFAYVPLIERRIPIIADDYVDMEFGTGALKVTPAHDKNDFQLGEKHGLEVIDTFNEDGTMSEAAQLYIGEDRFAVRKKIVAELASKAHLVKTEDYTSQVGFSERTDVPIEDRLSMQWWVDMKKLSTPALQAVLDEEIKFYPVKFRNLYRNWMENIRDWCISRQLWWGHRIPAWYDADGRFVVAKTEKEAKEIYNIQYAIGNKQSATLPAGRQVGNVTLTQDEDVLDTWFSSWLWPIEVFKGFSEPDNKDINYYYPTNTLVTAPEIIFFWVARMIMAGFEYKKEKPFSEVYFTGIVRDKQGRKMSKQLGNSPDLLALIDKYGADSVRFGIMIASPAGNDLLWDESSNEQGLFFTNKIWNALKLVRMWAVRTVPGYSDDRRPDSYRGHFAVTWFEQRLNEVKLELESQYRQFKLSEALKTIYSLIWDDFCSWYLEWIKPAQADPRTAIGSGPEQVIDSHVYQRTLEFFEELMQLLHPFMPFITEEVYHLLQPGDDDIVIKQYTAATAPDTEILAHGSLLKEVITAIRDARNKNHIKPKDPILVHIQSTGNSYDKITSLLQKQVNAEAVFFTETAIPNSITVVVQKDKFYIETTTPLDTASQKEQLLKDLDYLKGFLVSVEKKLSNEKFVKNAKSEVLEAEKKKKADAEEKIKIIEESLGIKD